MIWVNIKSFLLLYFRPAAAISGLIDSGSWWLALAVFVATSFLFHYAVKERVFSAYGGGAAAQSPRLRFLTQRPQAELDNQDDDDTGGDETAPAPLIGSYFYGASYPFGRAVHAYDQVPLLGGYSQWLWWTVPQGWLAGMAAMCLLYVPATIFALSLMAPMGSFGLVLRRDFGTVLTCVLMAWSATHLPFAVFGLAEAGVALNPAWFLLAWGVSTVWFGALMVCILRVVFGCDYLKAVIAVLVSWPAVSIGARLFGYLTPLLFSPFILIYLWMIARGEAGNLGASYRQRQNFRRYLASSTINPRDADARYQLGLIHQQRRQDAEAEAYFQQAIEIDPTEIDARYQLGRIARGRGQFAAAIEHFGFVVAEDDKHAQSEVWREVGATYLSAGMYNEAHEALEKYVDRRSFDPEGLYYLGETLSKLGRRTEAATMLERVLESVKTMPNYRRADVRRWSKLAREGLAALAG